MKFLITYSQNLYFIPDYEHKQNVLIETATEIGRSQNRR